MMSLRTDFFGELQKDESLYRAHRLINVPPLREAELREVVSRPAELLSARFEDDHKAAEEPQHTVTIAKPFAVGKFERRVIVPICANG
jgi:hypothetical protein